MSTVIEEINLPQAEAETWSAAELVSFALATIQPQDRHCVELRRRGRRADSPRRPSTSGLSCLHPGY